MSNNELTVMYNYTLHTVATESIPESVSWRTAMGKPAAKVVFSVFWFIGDEYVQ